MRGQIILEMLEDVYPTCERTSLARQWEAWRAEQPLKGMCILDGTPVFRNTLLKYANLLAAGAEVWVGYGRSMPHDPSIVAQLPSLGLHVADEAALAGGFDLVLDCAGAFAHVPSRYGYAELTRSGAYVYAQKNQPVVLVDAGRIKTFETALGTGDGLVRALQQLNYGTLEGKRVVLFGCGKVGRGIAFRCIRAGAMVVVIDPDAACLPPTGVTLMAQPTTELLRSADLIVTATGIKDALVGRVDPEVLIHSKALLINMGVEDEFGAAIPETRVLNRKAPLNFILDDPTRMRYIDPTMALHNAAAIRLIHGVSPGLHPPTPEEEKRLFDALPKALREELIAFEAQQIKEF